MVPMSLFRDDGTVPRTQRLGEADPTILCPCAEPRAPRPAENGGRR